MKKSGVGILERAKRKLKWDFAFWQEPTTLAELATLDTDFKNWHKLERIHFAIDFKTPWHKPQEDAILALALG